MKRAFLLFFTLIAAIGFIACNDKEDPKPKPENITVETEEASSILYTSAVSGGEVTGENIIARGVCWGTSASPTITGSKTTDGSGEGSFTSNITGLNPGTKYYVRAYATTNKSTYYGEQIDFTTLTEGTPLLSIEGIARSADNSEATVTVNISSDGSGNLTERGVVYGTTALPTVSNNKVTDQGSGTGTYSLTIGPLTEGTLYYVRGYAVVNGDAHYTEEATVRTPGANSVPTVSTSATVEEIGWSAVLTGNIVDLGDMDDAVVSESGIYFGTTQNVKETGEKLTATSSGDNFSAKGKVEQGETYYYAAYVKTQYGTGYGDVQSFTSRKIYGDFIKPRPADNSEVLPNSITPYNNGNRLLVANAYSSFYKDVLDVLDSYYPTLNHIAYVFRRVVDTNEPVLYISHSYEGGRATVYYKMSANSDNEITFTSLKPISGNTLTMLNNLEGEQKNIISNYLENYFTGSGAFRMGWIDGETNNVKLYPVNDPDNYISGASIAWTGSTYASDVADW